jgi:hypothetical protein
MDPVEAKFDMMLVLLKETREHVEAIKKDYARRTDLQSCRAHCDGVTAEVFGRVGSLETHKACQAGAEQKRKELQQEQDLDAQKGQRANMIVGAIIGGIFLVLATIGGFVMAKLWP